MNTILMSVDWGTRRCFRLAHSSFCVLGLFLSLLGNPCVAQEPAAAAATIL